MSGIVSAAMGAAASSLNPFSRGTVYTSSYEKLAVEPSDSVFRLRIADDAVLYKVLQSREIEINLAYCSLDQLADIAEQLVAMIEEKQKSA